MQILANFSNEAAKERMLTAYASRRCMLKGLTGRKEL